MGDKSHGREGTGRGGVGDLLFRTCRGELLALAQHCGLEPDEAEAVLQQVWLKMIVELKTPQGAGLPVPDWAPWLRQVLANEVRDWFRARRRHPTRPLEEVVGTEREPAGREDGPAGCLERQEAGAQVRGALEVLRGEVGDLNYRILVLRDLAELTPAEVARLVGLSEGAVNNRLNRAHQKLRKILGSDPRQGG
jgi:RNA polymerase sigma factor (sigma-70 family)